MVDECIKEETPSQQGATRTSAHVAGCFQENTWTSRFPCPASQQDK